MVKVVYKIEDEEPIEIYRISRVAWVCTACGSCCAMIGKYAEPVMKEAACCCTAKFVSVNYYEFLEAFKKKVEVDKCEMK